MKHKILAMLLVSAMLLSFTACGPVSYTHLFINDISKDTQLYKLMSTRPGEM